MFTPLHGIWKNEEIEAHPQDAISWARKESAYLAEAGERNANMDSGWSASEADRCSRGMATANHVELTALRFLVKQAVEKMDKGTTAWSEFHGWCPEFEALRTAFQQEVR
jgi:hypothetical protein